MGQRGMGPRVRGDDMNSAPPIGTPCPLLVLDVQPEPVFCLKKLLESSIRVDLRRTTSRHALQIRPSDRSRPPDHSAAPGAAYAHADPELFAEGHALQSLRELAAGSARQLAGSVRLSGEGDRTEGRGRFYGADDGGQSVRLLCRTLCHQLSVSIYRRSQDRTGALSGDVGGGATVRRVPQGHSAPG